MNSPKLIDSHLHLQDYEPGTDIGAVIGQSTSAGVSYLVCNGTSVESWSEILGFAERYSQVIPCFGIHPWFIPGNPDEWCPKLEEFLQRLPSGVGEIGLDRCREPYDKALQETAFRAQLAIARRYERPAMIHCVKAWGWMMDVLSSEPEIPAGMLIHSYGGSADLIKPLAKMGAYFSFSGKVLVDNYGRARRSIPEVPLDRLLIETDAPCMLPPEQFCVRTISASGGEIFNHPANLPEILKGVAALLDQSPDNLREILWNNAQRFFAPIMVGKIDGR